MLHHTDILIICVYFIVVIVVAYLSSRKQTKQDFLIAERKLGAFSLGLTVFASNLGAGTLLVYVSLVYIYGVAGIWYFIGFSFGYLIFFLLSRKWKLSRKSANQYTLADVFHMLYGKKVSILVGLFVLISMIGWVVVNLIGGASLLQEFGGIPFVLSTLIMGAVILAYLLKGGFRSVVITDRIQFIGILFLGFIMVYLLMNNYVSFFSFSFNLSNMPVHLIITFFLGGLLYPLASGDLWQRVHAAKHVRALKNGLIISAVSYLFIGVILTVVGLIIHTTFPSLDPNSALVVGLSKLLPVGLVGFAIVAFYSAIMSSADTYLFTANASLTRDILERLGLVKDSLIRTKVYLVFLGMLSIVLVLFVRTIVHATFLFTSLIMSAGIVVLIVLLFPRINRDSVFVGLLAGLCGTLLLAIIYGIDVNLLQHGLLLTSLGILAGWVMHRIKLSVSSHG